MCILLAIELIHVVSHQLRVPNKFNVQEVHVYVLIIHHFHFPYLLTDHTLNDVNNN